MPRVRNKPASPLNCSNNNNNSIRDGEETPVKDDDDEPETSLLPPPQKPCAQQVTANATANATANTTANATVARVGMVHWSDSPVDKESEGGRGTSWDDDNVDYGDGGDSVCRRSPLQNVAVFTAVLCSVCFVEGISVNGLPNINISSLETRYTLESKEAGFIASSGEIGAICVVLFVSFYGGRSHKPRVVAAGGYILGLGCVLFFLPHVLVSNYMPSGGDNSRPVACDTDFSSECAKSDRSDAHLYPLFIAGRLLQGMGFTPCFTCGFAYIDDHAPSDMTAVYIGITYAITALGAGMGYIIGGQFLRLWVDIGRVDLSTVKINNTDKRWVGAWWIGYVISAVLFVILSTLLCFFPKYMRGSKTVLKKKQMELVYRTVPEEPAKSVYEIIMAFPKTLVRLICNPLYILLLLVGTGDSLVVSGIASFAPKIIQEKFSIRPSESGAIMGTVTLLGGAGGMAMGGFLIRKFHLRLLGILKMVLANLILAAIFGGGAFFIHCGEGKFAGVNAPSGHSSPSTSMISSCNFNCTCTLRYFSPVCGEDGVTYFSSCYAGCPGAAITKDAKKYSSCTCIKAKNNSEGEADTGACTKPCPEVYPFIILMFFGMVFTFLNVTPVSMSVMRCVSADERSIGLGLQWLTLRLLATIPGPILVGMVLDSECVLWQEKCVGRGKCWLYNSHGMSLRLFLWWAAVKVISLCFLTIAYVVYTRHGHPEVDRQETQQRIDVSMSINSSMGSLGVSRSTPTDLAALKSMGVRPSTLVVAESSSFTSSVVSEKNKSVVSKRASSCTDDPISFSAISKEATEVEAGPSQS